MQQKSFTIKDNYGFYDLVSIMKLLRRPDGCPWDKEQTHKSIRNAFVEETYEAVDAIDNGDMTALREELGDVLMQVVFHSQIAVEDGDFDIDGVCDEVCKKLVYRHPHIFGDTSVSGSAEVLENWDKLKKAEKNQNTFTDTLKSVPRSFPALMRAQKTGKRAAKSGFDWDDVNGALDKAEEELSELRTAISDKSNYEEELGDLLFALTNVARFLHVDSEEALGKATDKFISRFEKTENAVLGSGKRMEELSQSELDDIWNRIKHLK